MAQFINPCAPSYDRVAPTYADRIADELEDKPLDRWLLDRLANDARAFGTICDLGCGPGHVGRYLTGAGASVVSADISLGMLRQARRISPQAPPCVADMRQLPFADQSMAGVCALYSIIHVAPDERPAVFADVHRMLRVGGAALIAFHVGEEILHLDDWWGISVSVDFRYLRTEVIAAEMRLAGFAIEDEIERAPYSGVEHPSRRGYICARRIVA